MASRAIGEERCISMQQQCVLCGHIWSAASDNACCACGADVPTVRLIHRKRKNKQQVIAGVCSVVLGLGSSALLWAMTGSAAVVGLIWLIFGGLYLYSLKE